MAKSVTLKKKNKLGVKIKTYNRIHSLPNGDLKNKQGGFRKRQEIQATQTTAELEAKAGHR